MKRRRKSIVKWNSGVGALLCSDCSVIIATGFIHPEEPQFCRSCLSRRRLTPHKGGEVFTLDGLMEVASILNSGKDPDNSVLLVSKEVLKALQERVHPDIREGCTIGGAFLKVWPE